MSLGPKRISLLPDDGWSWMDGASPHEPNAIIYVRADVADNISDALNLERALADGAHRRARQAEADRDKLLKLGQAVVNIVEGLDGFGLARSAIDGERLKDEAAWVDFYNGIKAATRATAPASPTSEGDET